MRLEGGPPCRPIFFSGERTRLACRLRRLAANIDAPGWLMTNRTLTSRNRLFGEAPNRAREARALPGENT